MSDPAAAILRLFDANVEWLVAHGREGQWGSEPWTPDPQKRAFVDAMLSRGEVVLAPDDAGALIIGETPPPYVEPAGERELYVHLLLADPARRGSGVGARLLDRARDEAAARGIELLRVDCWAGGDGRLVAYYEAQGFTRVSTFDSDGWPGQLLEQRLS